MKMIRGAGDGSSDYPSRAQLGSSVYVIPDYPPPEAAVTGAIPSSRLLTVARQDLPGRVFCCGGFSAGSANHVPDTCQSACVMAPGFPVL